MANDLVSLADYKTYKSINSTTNDDRLALIISGVSQFVKSFCSRSFNEYTVNNKVEFGHAGDSFYLLDEFPLIELVSVKLNTGTASVVLTEGTDYFVDAKSDRIIAANGRRFGTSSLLFGSLEITYKAGYLTIPEDIQLAVFDLVDIHKDGNFTTRRLQNGATEGYDDSTVPNHIKRVLNQYRRI